MTWRNGNTPHDNYRRRNSQVDPVMAALEEVYEGQCGVGTVKLVRSKDKRSNLLHVYAGAKVFAVHFTEQFRKEAWEEAKRRGTSVLRLRLENGSDDTTYRKLLVEGEGDHHATLYVDEDTGEVRGLVIVDLAQLRKYRRCLGYRTGSQWGLLEEGQSPPPGYQLEHDRVIARTELVFEILKAEIDTVLLHQRYNARLGPLVFAETIRPRTLLSLHG